MRIETLANVSDDRRSEGFVEVELFHQSDRMKLVLKKLAIFWSISVLSILIPVFHFVTVPLFFFLGIFFAYKSSKSEGKVLSGETTCPHCQNKVIVKEAELQWPLSEICQNCARVLRIEKK
jgi:hypothetical protein